MLSNCIQFLDNWKAKAMLDGGKKKNCGGSIEDLKCYSLNISSFK